MADRSSDLTETFIKGDRVDAWRGAQQKRAEASGAITELMLDCAGLGQGDHVLDVAAGTGDSTLLAARRVGSSGSV